MQRNKRIIQKVDLPVESVGEVFLMDRKAKNCRQPTIENYQNALRAFIGFLGDEVPISSVVKGSYDGFIEALKADERKNEVTVQSYCRFTRAFLYWCMDNGYCEEFSVVLPKAQSKVKQIYTDSEIALLLQKPQKGCSAVEYETWVFENLCFSTALRLRSMLNLKVSDVQEDRLYVNATKNGQGLVLTLNADMVRILKTYIKLFQLSADDYLFCTGDGKPYNHSTIKHYCNRYNRNRGVERTGIHLMRHTYAFQFYQRTHDVYALQKILGHAEVSTTEKYLRTIGINEVSERMTVWNPQTECVPVTKKRRGKLQ